MSTDVEGGGDRNPGAGRKNSLSSYPYSHRVFVGNLPRRCVESNLKDIFSKFGNVVNVRIDYNGLARNGFVIFEDEKSVADCLSQKPIYLPDGHRLNVETKKKNVSDDFLFYPFFREITSFSFNLTESGRWPRWRLWRSFRWFQIRSR